LGTMTYNRYFHG